MAELNDIINQNTHIRFPSLLSLLHYAFIPNSFNPAP